MDPTVKAIVDIVAALISAFGRPLLDAALSHHGYVPRRVEAILGPDDHGHASAEADALRGNVTPVEPEGGHSPRGITVVRLPDACTHQRGWSCSHCRVNYP